MPQSRVKLIPVMRILSVNLKHIVAAISAAVMYSLPLAAQDADLTRLYERLKKSDATDSKTTVREIRMRRAQSGSASIDLLLQRGDDAMARGETAAAIEHYTAVIDHAPDFAEGWYGRAKAFFTAEKVGPALSDLERALLLNPNHFDALYGLGQVLETLDKPDLAYETYALVLAMHPHYDEAKAARARLKTRVEGQKI